MKPRIFKKIPYSYSRKGLYNHSAVLCSTIAALLLGGTHYASAAIWTATGANDWNTSTNWDINAVPGVGIAANITTDSGSAVVVNYNSPMIAASFGALSIGYGTTNIAGHTSTLNVSAAGFNTTAANQITAGGNLKVNTGGVYNNASTLTLGVSGGTAPLNYATLTNDGGQITVNGATTMNYGAITLASGTSTFGRISLGQNFQGASKFTITGGINTLGDFTSVREGATDSTSTGLIVTGGTTTATKVVLSTHQGWGNMLVGGSGDFTINGNGGFIVGQGTIAGRGGSLVVSGGKLTYADTTTGLLLSNAANTVGKATFSGGVSNFGKITLIGSGITAGTGSATVTLSGGAVYIGSGGIVSNAGLNGNSATATVNLTNGGRGASANWSSSVSMALDGTINLKAADASDVAYNIVMNGTLSGNGGLTKTGSGTLTLSGSNIFTGATTVSAGELDVNGSIAVDSVVSVGSGAILGGNGRVYGTVAVTSGTINGSSLTLGATTFHGASTIAGTTTASSITVSTGTTTANGIATASTSLTVSDGATLKNTGTTSAATVAVDHGATLTNDGTLSGSVNVTGLLNGTGTVNGALTIKATGELAPGNSPGTTTVDGNFTVEDQATVSMQIDKVNAFDSLAVGLGGNYDQIIVNGEVKLTLGSVLNFTTLNNAIVGNVFNLILNDGIDIIDGVFTTVKVGGLSQEIANNGFTFGGLHYELSYTANADGGTIGNDLTMTVVPEPSTWVMMVGGIGLLAFGQRARRRFNA